MDAGWAGNSGRVADFMENEGHSGTGLEEKIRQIAEQVIGQGPLYVVDVNVRGNKGSRGVTVYIDGDEGVDVEHLARISREVGFILDTEEIVAGKYTLSVSSPGVDRPLTLPRQYRKNIGRTLEVVWRRNPEEGSTTLQGELLDANEESIRIGLPKNEPVVVPFPEIEKAVVKLPW